jgi:succinate dehydrogenase / fumarate reductase, cytochrome b subunit
MNWLGTLLGSNIGRKLVMALTGLFLISFLIVHLSGNLLLLKDDKGEAFNIFSQFMTTTGFIRVLEIVLVAGFVIHIYTSVVLTRRNASSRPIGYAAGNKTPGVNPFSKYMGLTGSLILLFLVIHIRTFWFTYHHGEGNRYVQYSNTMGNGGVLEKNLKVVNASALNEVSSIATYKDMAYIAQEAFNSPLYVAGYVLAVALLGFHLAHGFSSAFRTLGFEHKKYTPFLKIVGYTLAVIFPIGFASIPIFYYLVKPLAIG